MSENGVKVTVLTLQAKSYPEEIRDKTELLIDKMQNTGIKVYECPRMHEHFAIIDKEIVWYGSMNILSREKKDDNIMRIISGEIAQEIQEISLGKKLLKE